jgi:hypothetical protein
MTGAICRPQHLEFLLERVVEQFLPNDSTGSGAKIARELVGSSTATVLRVQAGKFLQR